MSFVSAVYALAASDPRFKTAIEEARGQYGVDSSTATHNLKLRLSRTIECLIEDDFPRLVLLAAGKS